MRPKKVLFSIGITHRGRNMPPKRAISVLIEAISILYAYIADLSRIFTAFYLFSLAFSYTVC